MKKYFATFPLRVLYSLVALGCAGPLLIAQQNAAPSQSGEVPSVPSYTIFAIALGLRSHGLERGSIRSVSGLRSLDHLTQLQGIRILGIQLQGFVDGVLRLWKAQLRAQCSSQAHPCLCKFRRIADG